MDKTYKLHASKLLYVTHTDVKYNFIVLVSKIQQMSEVQASKKKYSKS